MVQLSHLYITTGKNHSFDYVDLCWEVISLLFNTLFRFVIAFLWRSKHLLISWLQWFRIPRKENLSLLPLYTPSICHEMMGQDTMILGFLMLSLELTFSLSFFTLIKKLFSSSSIFAIRVVSSAYLRLLIFLLAILILACDSSSPTLHIMKST